MKALGRFLGFIAVYIPAVILIIWGGGYILSLLNALQDPSNRFSATIQAGEETLEIRIGGVQVNPMARSAVISRLDILESNGTLLGAANNIRASQNASSSTIKATIDKVWATVERDKDGKLNVSRYLSQEDTGQEPNPVQISIDTLDLRYRERSGQEPWSQSIVARDTSIYTLGEEITGFSRVNAPGLGQGEIRFQNSKGTGFRGKGDGNLDLDSVVDKLRNSKEGTTIPELKTLRITRGQANGPFELHLNPKGDFKLVADVKGASERIVFEEFIVENSAYEGRVTEQNFVGLLTGKIGQNSGSLDGRIDWWPKQLVRGNFTANSPSVSSLPTWIRVTIPKELKYQDGKAKGWLSWDETTTLATGRTSFSSLNIAGEPLANPTGNFVVVGDQAGVDLKSGTWQSTAIQGQILVSKGELSGTVKTGTINIQKISEKYGVKGFSGNAKVAAVVGGNINKPKVVWQASGNAISSATGSRINLGKFAANGQVIGDLVKIDRLQFEGENGIGVGTGTVNAKNQAYNFDIRGRQIPISTFTAEATGIANFGGQISGKGSQYKAEGLLEIFHATTESGATLAYGSANIFGTPDLIRANDLIAFDDLGARLQGWLALEPSTSSLSGILRGNGIDLESYTDSGVTGSARFSNGIVSGTLQKPGFSAEVAASSIVAGAVRFPRASAKAILNGTQLELLDLVADVSPGTITGSALFDLATLEGTFEVKVADLDVETLVAQVAETAKVEGKVSEGEFTGRIVAGKVDQAEGFLQIGGFKLNDSLVGSGRINASKEKGFWAADAAIGYDSQYLELALDRFDEETGDVKGQVTAGNIEIQQLYAAFKRYTTPQNGKPAQVELSPEAKDFLPYLRGSVSALADISGNSKTPLVELKTFDITKFFVAENPLGDQPVPKNSATFHAEGQLDPEGNFGLTGFARNFEPSWLSRLNKSLGNLEGMATIDAFQIKGGKEDLSATVSAGYAEYELVGADQIATLGGAPEVTRKLKRSVDLVANLANEEWAIDGGYQAEGFTGGIEALIPFNKDFAIPDDKELSAKVAIGPVDATNPAAFGRPLRDLREYFPGLDLNRSNGVLTANLTAKGFKDNLNIQGSAQLLPEPGKEAPILAFNGDGHLFQPEGLRLDINNEGLRLYGQIRNSEGGELLLNDLAYRAGNFQDVLAEGMKGILNRPVSGSLAFNAFKFRYNDKTAGPIESTIDGNIAIEALLAAPKISGNILLSNANIAIPTFPETTAAASEPLVNPSFDISVSSANPMRFRAGTGDFKISGLSKITGDLINPSADALMVVDQGTIRLPNARISIDEGGTIAIVYRSNGTARADLQMSGRTQITAAGPSGAARYDINLDITGNLLQDGDLRLRATSDPPDLSEGQILALLGQRQLVEGFTLNEDPAKQIQAALFQVAVPYLATTLTDRLASSIGLDYLSLDYDPFDQLTLSAAVQMGRHLTLSARRQLSSPVVGIPPKFDIRLSYRPPFGGKTLRRLSFSIGSDQDRPWKFGIEYGIRF